jgi:hypothetical protein
MRNAMRVRPTTSFRERRRSGSDRAAHLLPGRAKSAPEPEAAPAPPVDDHPDERRARESGGPIDKAQYACACGYVFLADVSTSVACPHCGAAQAW